jgi:periplasmic divalent cation tolerance protein
MEWVQINWSAGSLQDARIISRYLVQQHVVAQVKIIPWVESIALLNNQLETTQETLVQFITVKSHFNAVKEAIEKQGKFEIAELTVSPFSEINPAYFEWLEENLKISVGN